LGTDIQLIYLSDLAPGQEAELPAILETAVRRNAQDGITGMLLYSGGNIMQVLEGEESAVRATYSRIGKDPRHRNLVLLSDDEISERSFANWSMGFKQLDPEVAKSFPQFAPYFHVGLQRDAIQAKPGAARDLLQFFAQKGR
jgi:hypothetical protein